MTEKLDSQEASRQLPPPWQIVDGKPTAEWKTDSFRLGAEFVMRIAEVADEMNHHPDVLVTYPSVEVTTISHDVDAITERDLALAERVCMVAGELGLAAPTDE